MLWQLLANGFVNGCVFGLIALSFALIYNTTRVFHIAHGAIYTVAAYLCYFFLIQRGIPLWASVGLTLILTALLGVATQRLLYAPLQRRGASLAIALLSSLGLYVALVNLVAMLWGNETKVLRPGVETIIQIGSVILTRVQLAQAVVGLLLIGAILIALKTTRWGQVIRAVRDNPTLSTVMGIDTQKVQVWVFGAGSAFVGVAAILVALDVGMDPQVGLPMLLTAAAALIIGGVGTFGGPVAGAFLIALMQSLLIWKVSARWVDAFTFGLLVLCLVFRPQGLLSGRRRIEEAVE